LRAGWCSAEFHTLGCRGSNPGPAMNGNETMRSMARYANWHSDQVESLMSVGSTPTRATGVRRHKRPVVQWQRHLSYKEETGVRLPPGRLHSSPGRNGPWVCWLHSSLVKRGTEFDSRADLFDDRMGCWSNGTTPGLQPGNRGSTPRRSTRGEMRRQVLAGSLLTHGDLESGRASRRVTAPDSKSGER
jgi:hypothetical protein